MYTLPMPSGLSALLVVVGVVFALEFGASSIAVILAIGAAVSSAEFQSFGFVAFSAIGLFISIPLTLIGVECLRQGIAGCSQHVTDPVDFSQPRSSVDEQEVKRQLED